MRLRACLGILMLATGACAHIPDVIWLEIDGSTVEFKKKPQVRDSAEGSNEQPQASPHDRGE